MSRAVVVSFRPHYVIVPKLNTQHMTVVTKQWRIQRRGPGGRPRHIFRPKWSPKGRKTIFLRPFPVISGSGWLPPPPPTSSQGEDLHCHSSGVIAISSTFSPSWMLMAYCCNWVCVEVRTLRWRGLLNMAHCFDLISCGMKQMYAQFSLLFGLHNAMVLSSKLSW